MIYNVKIEHFGNILLELWDRVEESSYMITKEKDHACKEKTVQSSNDLYENVVSFQYCYVLCSNLLAYNDYRGNL